MKTTSQVILSRDLDGLLLLAKEAAARAAAIHKKRFGEIHTISVKSSRTDLVSEVDVEAEKAIIDTITRERPNDAILAEEGGSRSGDSGLRWVIDPLDGTVNYLYRYPGFTVSIGLEVDGRKTLGVVHDSYHNQVYSSLIGRSALCDEKPISVSRENNLAQALLATGFIYLSEQRQKQAEILVKVIPRVRDIRRSGSASLDLCLLASGRIDCFFEAGLSAWDVAAGGVIARAAGARVVTLPSKKGPSPILVAAPPGLFDSLIDLLEQCGVVGRNDPTMEEWK
ncbi:MAG: inositol monophosphatase [Deltaproteobacteria bacterium]|nr:inositol monophosphatase [Deltaproteobacteria bacterium]